eukprot:scaffold185495_cov49-Attheya_sp.AAC.1
MSSLQPLTYTVNLKEPVQCADDMMGLSVYLNDQVEDHYCPAYYLNFMNSVRAAESEASSSSSSVVAGGVQVRGEMDMFRRVYRANCALKKNFQFDELSEEFGMEWRLLLIPQSVFMDKNFEGNAMRKLRNSFKFSDFFDKMMGRLFQADSSGKKMWQDMGTKRQIRNLFFVCRVMTVATYLQKEEKELLKNKHFNTALTAIMKWCQAKKAQEISGANHVQVNENSLTVHDTRGTSTCFSNYFIEKLHAIFTHSKGIFAQENGGRVLVGPRIINSMSTTYLMVDKDDESENEAGGGSEDNQSAS